MTPQFSSKREGSYGSGSDSYQPAGSWAELDGDPLEVGGADVGQEANEIRSVGLVDAPAVGGDPVRRAVLVDQLQA